MARDRTVVDKHKPRSATPLDVEIGARVKLARKLIGWSQQQLGDVADISFQQIQKYERGQNRISASRLVQIAKALNKPISYFYGDENIAVGMDEQLLKPLENLSPDDAARLLAALDKADVNQRRSLIQLIESLG
jgi:transcriptional regulator with XRE-family HTH domain